MLGHFRLENEAVDQTSRCGSMGRSPAVAVKAAKWNKAEQLTRNLRFRANRVISAISNCG